MLSQLVAPFVPLLVSAALQPGAQQRTEQAQAAAIPAPTARADDVSSPEAIVAALYDVISGPAGMKRDWDRFRSLHLPGARLIPTGVSRRTGRMGARILSPEDYIALSRDLIESKGFYEREIASRMERFGSIAHVFSTYEARFKATDAQPFMRGINSIQLYFDGQRWWILNVSWADETAQDLLPKEFLPPQ